MWTKWMTSFDPIVKAEILWKTALEKAKSIGYNPFSSSNVDLATNQGVWNKCIPVRRF